MAVAFFAVGLAIANVTAAFADGVDLGCDPDSCGPVNIPDCSGCSTNLIGQDGGAGAPGHPING